MKLKLADPVYRKLFLDNINNTAIQLPSETLNCSISNTCEMNTCFGVYAAESTCSK